MREMASAQLGARPVVSRSVWALAGQGLSSSSNFILSTVILATATRSEFAVFAVCLMSYLLVSQLARSLLSLPVLILYSGSAPLGVPPPVRSVAGIAVMIGAAASAPLALAAAAAPEGRSQFLVLALLMPLLLYQDLVRHVAFSRGDPKSAAFADGLWLLLQLAGSAAALALGHRSPALHLGLWAVSGGISGCVFGVALGAVPRFAGMAAWVREHWRLCAGLAWEFAFISGSTYLLYYGLALVAGADQLGRIRAAQTFIGPVTVALLAGAAVGVPESVRLRHDPPRLHRFAVVLAGGLAAGSLVFGALAYWLLPAVGPDLFPETWAGARPVVPVLTVFSVALAVSTGAACPLRAMGQVAWIARTRALTGALALALGLAASTRVGANGAVAALAGAEALFGVFAWRRLHRSALGQGLAGPGNDPVPADTEGSGPVL